MHNLEVTLLQPPDEFICEEPRVGRDQHGDGIAFFVTAKAARYAADEVEEDNRHDESPHPCFAARQQIAQIAVSDI